MLAHKLKNIKDKIKGWLAQERDARGLLKKNIETRIVNLDDRMENGGLSEVEISEWVDNKSKLGDIISEITLDLKQRSRVKWLVEGDENSSFFHGMINHNIGSNRLNGIQINNNWVTDPTSIKEEAWKFFAFKFREPKQVRPTFVCPSLKQLSPADANRLVSPFSEQEVKAAIWDCGCDRAPGPDGLTFGFIKHFWILLKEDIMSMMTSFFETGVINRGCASSFIALIPKGPDPITFNEFRPISLIGCISKIISKVLANRIKPIMDSVVTEVQSGFLASRNILDGPLILNEVCSWARKSSVDAFILKVDMEKAYDTINWGFILSVLSQMGFPPRWCMWVKGILESSRASVLINGSPSREFQCFRGVRQGDPLSPFLFILAMEALTCFIQKAKDLGSISSLQLPNNGPSITHLMYADDIVFVGEWGDSNLKNIIRLMRCFALISGLKINHSKTSLFGIGVSISSVENMAAVVCCKADKFPCKYLGVPVGVNMNQIKFWEPVVEVFKKRLSKWKAKHLSFGGRVVLIRAVLDSLPLYFFSLFKAPIGVINTLEALRRRFFWGGDEDKSKTNWIAWERVVGPTAKGGLGFGSLKTMNESLLVKWWWRFKFEQRSLWCRVISAIHHCNHTSSYLPVRRGLAGVWNAIFKVGDCVLDHDLNIPATIKGVVGDGLQIRFWLDWWTADGPLKDRCPALFALESHKAVSVAARVQNWGWIRAPSSNFELTDLQLCSALIAGTSLSSNRDHWVWVGAPDGLFSVSVCRKLLQSHAIPFYPFQWVKGVPKKVSVFIWRAEQNRLPTKEGLLKRKIIQGPADCKLCGEAAEDADHLLTSCYIASWLWHKVSLWCKISPIFAFTVRDLLKIHNDPHIPKYKQKWVHIAILAGAWTLWKARNTAIFQGKRVILDSLFGEVQAISFSWVNHKLKPLGWTWEKWKVFEVPIT